MKLFPQDADCVLYETGFEDDILGRAPLSKQLSGLVERLENPVVIALDDKWGNGKTYFLKRWCAAHKKENNGSATTVYFDAFENDYVSDPLVSIIGAVSDRIPAKQQSTIRKWKAVATKIAKPTFGIALSLATFGAKQHLEELGDVLVDSVSSEAKDATRNLWDFEKERRSAIEAFKDLLVKLTQDQDAPIIVVIDELDRCRPDYALSVLEIIKHFFSVPRVHFVLGINGAALENSVKARYGTDVDAESYLRKFINISFSLPRLMGPRGDESTVARYAAQLISDMDLPRALSERCANLMLYVAARNEMSLRDVGKILSKIAILPTSVLEGRYKEGFIDILCVLLASSVVDPKLHRKLVSSSASIDEISEFLGASAVKTAERIDGNYNPEYDHGLTLWLVTTIYACGPESALDDDRLPSWKDDIGSRFDSFGRPQSHRKIPFNIQKDWVDVFRV
ncbi:P-loop NTPase fold protein [uncultured Paracoccus sp.]|uniref:KAP family P-loop NTPase fold protein n=1 Tax=uncultured Paracoccus sp. TaxID=189685 RepID=UPI0026042013|nr:P-loop NTPase fold protein [uncultured Paracoccus sp.]